MSKFAKNHGRQSHHARHRPSAGYPTFNFFSPGGDISFWQEWHSPSDTLEFMTAKAGGQEGMESGFNSLVWSSLDLFIRVDNAEDFYGNWYSESGEA